MANFCEICGKGPQSGHNIRHKHSGSWALRAPKTNKRWLPNLQTVHVMEGKNSKKKRVCTKCIKAGKALRA